MFSVKESNSGLYQNLNKVFSTLKDNAEYIQVSAEKKVTEELENNLAEQEPQEEYIATLDMSHYTNETGAHVPKYEGGARDRKGNLLVAYDSIAIPKKLYSKLPYGSKIKIVTSDGDVYYGKAVDTGSILNKLNRIDRCVSSYKEAESLGVVKNVKIYKIG